MNVSFGAEIIMEKINTDNKSVSTKSNFEVNEASPKTKSNPKRKSILNLMREKDEKISKMSKSETVVNMKGFSFLLGTNSSETDKKKEVSKVDDIKVEPEEQEEEGGEEREEEAGEEEDEEFVEVDCKLEPEEEEEEDDKAGEDYEMNSPSSDFGKKSFHCNVCNQVFEKAKNLDYHIRRIHLQEKRHFCSFCSKGYFDSKDKLTHEKSAHKNEKPTCPICNVACHNMSNVRGHMKKVHSRDRDFSCANCPKTFQTNYDLRKHEQKCEELKARMEEKTIVCDICDGRYSTEKLLRRHIVANHNDVTWSCDFCEKAFRNKVLLKTHSMICQNNPNRLEEKTFVCQFCNAGFTMKTYLNRHIRKIHKEDGSFEIDGLLESNKSPSTNTVESKEIEFLYCAKCSKSFQTNYWLQKHEAKCLELKSEIITCDICNGIYPTEQMLKRHVTAYHNDKIWKCDFCEKTFKNNALLKGHSVICPNNPNQIKEKNFGCSFCNAEFTLKTYLNKHYRKVHKESANQPLTS
jgi:KRAB domain-containing zinc finger protein